MRNHLAFLGVIVALLLGFALHSLGSILVPFIAGFVGAYILNRPVTALSTLKIPRGLGSLFMILAVLFVLGLLMMVAVPFFQKEFILLSKNMPALIEHFYSLINPLLNFVTERLPPEDMLKIKAQIGGQFGSIMTWMVQFIINILSNGLALANVVSLVILTPVVMFYILKDWPEFMEIVQQLLPRENAPKIIHYAQVIDRNLASYAKGQMLVCLILAILYSIGLAIVGLKNAVFVGIFTGCISFIPYVGALIGFLVSILVHLSSYDTWNPLISIGFVFLIVQAIEGNVLTPRFVGGRIGVPPVWVLFGLLAGATWFGFFGIVLALPAAAIISTIVRALWKEIR